MPEKTTKKIVAEWKKVIEIGGSRDYVYVTRERLKEFVVVAERCAKLEAQRLTWPQALVVSAVILLVASIFCTVLLVAKPENLVAYKPGELYRERMSYEGWKTVAFEPETLDSLTSTTLERSLRP